MKSRNLHNAKARILFTSFLVLFCSPFIMGQTNNEIDEILRRDKAKKEENASIDSLLLHLKNKWEIKFSLGRFSLSPERRSQADEPFFLPDHLFLTQLGTAWHFGERWQAELGIGFQFKRNLPSTPNISSIFSGDDIRVEGSGILLMPIDLGVRYAFLTGRFRPLAGLSVGTIAATSRYIVGEGNLFDGIDQTETAIRENARYTKLVGGFDYRLAKGIQSNFTIYYTRSQDFSQVLGGYQAYSGLGFQLGFSIIPF